MKTFLVAPNPPLTLLFILFIVIKHDALAHSSPAHHDEHRTDRPGMLGPTSSMLFINVDVHPSLSV